MDFIGFRWLQRSLCAIASSAILTNSDELPRADSQVRMRLGTLSQWSFRTWSWHEDARSSFFVKPQCKGCRGKVEKWFACKGLMQNCPSCILFPRQRVQRVSQVHNALDALNEEKNQTQCLHYCRLHSSSFVVADLVYSISCAKLQSLQKTRDTLLAVVEALPFWKELQRNAWCCL